MQAGFAFSKFAERLASIVELPSSDLELLTDMPSTIRHYGSHYRILQKGDIPDDCCLILKGYLCWQDSGGRITSIHVPGDVPDLHAVHKSRILLNLVTLGPTVVSFVPHQFFRNLCALSPTMAHALSLLLIADMANLRNWIVNLGSRDALTRVAHILCEIETRLRAVGLAKDFEFPSPFTQSDLAAACGISAVHANRTIQELRRGKLLQWQSKTITITNWKGLVRIARFDPDYLGLHAPDVIEQPITRELRAPVDVILS